MPLARHLQTLTPDEMADAINEIIADACDNGFSGWGGGCWSAAVAINRILFESRGTVVTALNAPFAAAGRRIGHCAVLVGETYWDADGKPKSFEDVESWGMLDHSDTDWIKAAKRLQVTWNDEAANEVVIEHHTDEATFISLMKCKGATAAADSILYEAAEEWLFKRRINCHDLPVSR